MIDGVDYSSAGIHAIREEVVKIRDKALVNMTPETVTDAIVLSHAIAQLHLLHGLVVEIEKQKKAVQVVR